MKFKSIFFIKIFVSFLNLYTNYIYYIADGIKQILIYIRTKYIIIWNCYKQDGRFISNCLFYQNQKPTYVSIQ